MVNNFVKKLLNNFVEEFNNGDNKKILYDEVITPILEKFTDKIFPYVTLLFIMYSLNLILIVIILFIILNSRKA